MNRIIAVIAIGSVALAGCSNDEPVKPLSADQFYQPVDKGGAVPQPVAAPTVTPAPASTGDAIATVVTENVRAAQPLPEMVSGPTLGVVTTRPATPATLPTGQFVTIGGVIAEVNGNPIYADDILRTIEPILSARAKELEPGPFSLTAGREISRQVDEMIRSEVEFAAADRNCDADDKTMANRMTTSWRERQITAAKGSIEQARKLAKEQTGRSFDDLLKDQYRLNLTRVYYQKKLIPRIQITAMDMRNFYDRHREELFTKRESISFRVIKVATDIAGSDAAAKQKAEDILKRIKGGEDFATIAGTTNDDPIFLKEKGMVGPIDKGAFALDEIDKAVWTLGNGQVSDVIKSRGGYYIARVENKVAGLVRPFEEDAVQKQIVDALRSQQFGAMRNEVQETLRRESVIVKNTKMIDTTTDMAVANYQYYRTK